MGDGPTRKRFLEITCHYEYLWVEWSAAGRLLAQTIEEVLTLRVAIPRALARFSKMSFKKSEVM